MKDHNPPPEAARTLRTRIEQQLEAYARLAKTPLGDARANVHASFPAEPTLALLADLEDLFDRVQLIEATFRRWDERLQFLYHVSRMLGHEDWTNFDLDDRTPLERGLERPASSSTSSSIGASSMPPDPGSLVSAAQAGVPAPAVPASSSSPDELAGVRQTRQ